VGHSVWHGLLLSHDKYLPFAFSNTTALSCRAAAPISLQFQLEYPNQNNSKNYSIHSWETMAMWFLFLHFFFFLFYVFCFLPFNHFALPIYEWSDFRCCSVFVVTVPGKCFERRCIQWSALSARNTWTQLQRKDAQQ